MKIQVKKIVTDAGEIDLEEMYKYLEECIDNMRESQVRYASHGMDKVSPKGYYYCAGIGILSEDSVEVCEILVTRSEKLYNLYEKSLLLAASKSPGSKIL